MLILFGSESAVLHTQDQGKAHDTQLCCNIVVNNCDCTKACDCYSLIPVINTYYTIY